MNFKKAAATNLFRVLQLRSCRSLDRDRGVFFKRLYGCPLAFCPAWAAWTWAGSSLPLDRHLAPGICDSQCCRSTLYFCGLFIWRTVDKMDCVHAVGKSGVPASDREQKWLRLRWMDGWMT